MLNSREPGYRKVSRLSLPTQVFQINEPLFFGFPIVFEPHPVVPYILNALLLTACTFLLMQWGVIHKPFVNVPGPRRPSSGITCHAATGKRGVGALSILIAMAVYYPFAKAAERQRLKASRKSRRGPAPPPPERGWRHPPAHAPGLRSGRKDAGSRQTRMTKSVNGLLTSYLWAPAGLSAAWVSRFVPKIKSSTSEAMVWRGCSAAARCRALSARARTV
jgi:hypothetical protein